MHFCAITPIRWLEMFDKAGPCHMALAQNLKHRAYLDHYIARLKEGHTVILDNGAYENEQLNYKCLTEAIELLLPTYIVLPDDPGDYRSSSMMSLDFIEYLKAHNPSILKICKSLWICHAADDDLPNFINSYELGVNNAHGIGLSRLTQRYGLREEVPEMRRVQFIDYLKTLGKYHPSKYVHAFGMLGGSLLELPHLADRGVNSIDSSAPVWRGLMGYRLSSSWPDFKFQVDPPMWAKAPVENYGCVGEYLATSNLRKVLEACQPSK
jgi:hypothetical protein